MCMLPNATRIAALMLASVAGVVAPAEAQDRYPARHIRVLSSTGAGSGPDVFARIITDHMSRELGQQLVMENNSTAGGLIAAQQVADAAPDGYTLLSASASVFTVLPVRQERAPRIVEQLKSVAYYCDMPLLITVPSSLGVSTLAELIELARREPTKMFYAGNTNGSLPHMSGVLLNDRVGGGFTFVPYRSAADGLKDLLGGQINMMIEGLASLEGALNAGSIKALGLTNASRLPNMPDVPTVGEVLPGYVAAGWAGLFAPAGTPDAIVTLLNAALNKVVVKPEVKARIAELGGNVRQLSPDELTAQIRAEQKQWTPIVRRITLQQVQDKK